MLLALTYRMGRKLFAEKTANYTWGSINTNKCRLETWDERFFHPISQFEFDSVVISRDVAFDVLLPTLKKDASNNDRLLLWYPSDSPRVGVECAAWERDEKFRCVVRYHSMAIAILKFNDCHFPSSALRWQMHSVCRPSIQLSHTLRHESVIDCCTSQSTLRLITMYK